MTITIPHDAVPDARDTYEWLDRTCDLRMDGYWNERTDGTLYVRLRTKADPSEPPQWNAGDVTLRSDSHTPEELAAMLTEEQRAVAHVDGTPLAAWLDAARRRTTGSPPTKRSRRHRTRHLLQHSGLLTITIPHDTVPDARDAYEHLAYTHHLRIDGYRNQLTDGTLYLRFRTKADPSDPPQWNAGDVTLSSVAHTPDELAAMLTEEQRAVAHVDGTPLAAWLDARTAADDR